MPGTDQEGGRGWHARMTSSRCGPQIGRRLYVRRVWLDLSQQDVADKAHVTRNFISAIERGSQGLDAWRLGRVADAIDVTLDWLLSGSDDLTAATLGRRSEA